MCFRLCKKREKNR